jgi:TolB protein
MNADGTAVRRLTTNPFPDIRPSFSPDGKRLAFTSSRDGNYEIYIVNTDGTGLQRVNNHPERDDYPSWHPDGKKLVVVSERDGRHDLYLIDVSR